VIPEHRYLRVVNGFAARLDSGALGLLERDAEVSGVYPVRAAYPAVAERGAVPLVGPSAPAVPGVAVGGLDGTGVTVALLDTGIDPFHPYLRGRLLPGIDVIAPGSGAVAQPHPTIPGRPERHGTELAGIIAGSGGPDGLHGVAPGASVLPVRVAGWQAGADGRFAVYSRTDQVLAGLEAAVDPDQDGETQDAARIAVVGVVEPYASFPDGPVGRAVQGALSLDMLVIAPAGNDGRAGPSFGSIGSPGGAPAALTVAATDTRLHSPSVPVHVRAGLRVLFAGDLALGGVPSGRGTVTAVIASVPTSAGEQGIARFFDPDGVSLVAGRAALLPRGAPSEETVEEAALAGAVSILVDGPLPAGAFGLDVPSGVPVVGLTEEVADEARALIASGIPVTVSVGPSRQAENPDALEIAPFSSRGLGFFGELKPELGAPGVAIPTAEPGRSDEGEIRYGTVSGTSAAAAVVGGAAALVAQRNRIDASALLGLLVGSAQPLDLDARASGAGLLDAGGAAAQEVVVEPAVVSFGSVVQRGVLERTITIRNVSTRPLSIRVDTGETATGEIALSASPGQVRLSPLGRARVLLRAVVPATPDGGGWAAGEITLHVSGSSGARVPWALAFPDPDVPLLSDVRVSKTGAKATDATPAVLSLVVGAVTGGKEPSLRPVELLEVQLWSGGAEVGPLARRRELLPGRYAFGLTGRDGRGDPLDPGAYEVRVVARVGDGTPPVVVRLPYPVL
jgi:subtilisin family serine protease